MATPTPKPDPKKALAAKIAKMKKNPVNYTKKGVYGFDGMQGIPAKDAKLKGK